MDLLRYFVERMRGASAWPQTEATVLGCNWSIGRGRSHGDAPGWYEVTFSYHVEGEYYGGRFSLPRDDQSESPYREGDKLVVGYDPRRPEHNYPQGIGDTKAQALKILAIFMALFFGLLLCIGLLGKK
jgi:hypothetical protein